MKAGVNVKSMNANKVLPIVAAVCGMVAPALVFLAVAWGAPGVGQVPGVTSRGTAWADGAGATEQRESSCTWS